MVSFFLTFFFFTFHSQGPLSSIRAAIKRSERPEITILSAEPLTSTSWFPGASAGFPPPPPPAPPPSYEEVIKEKTQEQVLMPCSSSCSSSSSSRPVSTITIATQTEAGSATEPQDSQARPLRPTRPPLPSPPRLSHSSSTTSQSGLSDGVVSNTAPDTVTHASAHTQCCDLLSELRSSVTSATAAQTDQWDQCLAAVDVAAPPDTSSNVLLERPTPRPRSKLGSRPISSEVKVQTLVKLREDSFATLAARAESESTKQGLSQGKYLQELLDAFSSDDWGFPEQRSDSSGNSQSESEEGEQEDGEEDMAALKARIQAFEQQVADGNSGDSKRDFVVTKRPEPRPRPRLQVQPSKSVPPSVAPKPKNLSQVPKPSSKAFWEDGALKSAESGGTDALKSTETPSIDLNPEAEAATEPSCTPKSPPSVLPQPCKTTEKPPLTPKPQAAAESPVPAPRPPPPKLTHSLSDASLLVHPKLPPRPPVAPRPSMGSPNQEKSTTTGLTPHSLPLRPSAECFSGAETEAGRDETSTPPGECESVVCEVCCPLQAAEVTTADLSAAFNLQLNGKENYYCIQPL
uniref:Uncharacterized protein n=1 Tax=Mastacembelus armatus TaxID=205130 RepID=A0A3Q3RTY5_9TELE